MPPKGTEDGGCVSWQHDGDPGDVQGKVWVRLRLGRGSCVGCLFSLMYADGRCLCWWWYTPRLGLATSVDTSSHALVLLYRTEERRVKNPEASSGWWPTSRSAPLVEPTSGEAQDPSCTCVVNDSCPKPARREQQLWERLHKKDRELIREARKRARAYLLGHQRWKFPTLRKGVGPPNDCADRADGESSRLHWQNTRWQQMREMPK